MFDAEKIFGKDGLIPQKMKNYESRPQQIEMYQAIFQGIEQAHHLMVEAGTGVGKTFAYLVPAIEQALAEKKPVIIATHTINLQEQIVHKDIPFLKDALGLEFNAVLVKGRHNYICLRRLNRASNFQADFFDTSLELEEFSRLKEWGKKTREGSTSDLKFIPSDRIWSAICCETDNCAGKGCSYYKECFYRQARATIWKANIIVVNHALLLLDALLREEETNLLPNYEIMIIDEAHRLERVAQNHLGVEITTGRVNYLLNSIYNPGANRGLLSLIPPRIAHLKECKQSIFAARECADTFFNQVLVWFNTDAPENGRIKAKQFIQNTLSPAISKLYFDLKELKEALSQKKYKTPGKQWDEIELSAYVIRTASLAMDLDNFMNQGSENHVYWVEVEKKQRLARPRILLKSAPIEVAQSLKSLLFEKVKTAVLTSATLATSSHQGLTYLKGVLGIENAKEVLLGSSFDYQKQVKIYLTRDLPDPNDKISFLPMASERIMKYLRLSKGSAFVLFTNYDLMYRIYERLTPELEKLGMITYVQGKDLPRHRMLEEFKNRVGSVIFGADSFWEGVDVPGPALENIIITKLPFPVPSEPLSEAKIEKMEKQGIDSFMNYFIPEAILKLRQGFGRLIRTRTDKGIVVILDPRVVTKQYGRFFLDALPKCPIIVDNV